MERASSRTRLAAWLIVAAVLGTALLALIGDGEMARIPMPRLWLLGSSLWSAELIRRGTRAWPGWRGTVLLLYLIAFGSVATSLSHAIGHAGYEPSPTDVLYLAFLIPLWIAARGEFRAHFDDVQRRETLMDAALMTLGVTALLYPFVRPLGADAAASVTALAFTVISVAAASIFASLVLWVPSRPHTLLLLAYLPATLATFALGYVRVRGGYDGSSFPIDAMWFVSPLALAGLMVIGGHGQADGVRAAERVARPILSSVATAMACTALVVVALVDRSRQLGAGQVLLLIAALSVGIAVRALTNQVAATHEHAEVSTALGRREAALVEADRALERVREVNETLRRSEEHLRLVFEAAVDGFVEIDERGHVIRANRAFGTMVRQDPIAMEGRSWSELAAAVIGSDDAFMRLPEGGAAQIERTDGGPLYLESRFSDLPTEPGRRLLLIRDVTASKISEQTIRSLLQFLQDRDEDRSRVLKRTNAAIEQERNRIARDLHDGPVQGVSAASLSLEAALLMIEAGDVEQGVKMLSALRGEIATEADGLRRLMSGLRPPVLEERGLFPAVRDLLSHFGTEQEVETELVGSVPREIPKDLEVLSYRVVQEALANIARHAKAHQVTVRIEGDPTTLRVEVQDDGTGFDTSRSRDFLQRGRVGLAMVRERVELASGIFTVRSTPGRGTTVTASIPVDAVMISPGDA